MRSLQIYEDREEEDKKIDISGIEPEKLVSEVCKPVANRQRLLMLKALSGESKTFSELSKLTGMRGGNLLFHLQKLLETGMVLQRMNAEIISLPERVTPLCRVFLGFISILKKNKGTELEKE
jgi:DNA-binding transcriptional ArsR family regulator